jgi:metallo-beta-lactamase family protein
MLVTDTGAPLRAPVGKATLSRMFDLLAHENEIMIWFKQFKAAPRRTFITHGEPAVADRMRLRIQEELHWDTYASDYLEIAAL